MAEEDKPANSPVQQDKRCTLRVPLIVEQLPCGDSRRTFFGYARNLSRGGAFIATVNPRDVGEQFDLHLTLPPSAGLILRCRCEVVWRRQFERVGKPEPGMGLRFLDLPQETADALERWLRSVTPQC